MSIRVNIGCGQTPTEGWHNYDNSIAVRIARIPIIGTIAQRSGLLSKSQREFISFARGSNIRWADATKHIPEQDGSVEVLYSSHMIEHLDRDKALSFLKQARRVLKPDGIIRLAVPDLNFHIKNYLKEKNADNFIEKILLTNENPKTIIEKIKYLIIGDRNHKWMYDGQSLCRLLMSAGFKNPTIMEPGSTMINNAEALNLKERYPESVFVEATSSQ